MAAAILANPLTWVAVALIAIAVAVYEVGKSFGWWTDVGSMISAITAGLHRLWSAFINNPNVQGFLNDLSNAWNDICEALAPVIDWARKAWNELFPPSATGSFDIVRAIIDVFGQLGDFLGKVVNSAKSAWEAIGSFGVALAILGPVGLIVEALRRIVCILLGCSPGIVPALRQTQAVFMSVFGAIAGFIGGAVGNIVSILRTIISSLTGIFTRVASIVMTNLTRTISSVISWASTIVSKGKSASSKFLSSVVSYFSQLPNRVGNYISSTTGRIASGASSWVSNARSKASGVVTAVIGQVSRLPGKVYSEFMGIGSRMLSAGSQLVAKARQIGRNIVSGLLSSMGIASPGTIQRKVVLEFENTLGRVGDMTSTGLTVGRAVGSSIVNGFGDFDLTAPTLKADYAPDDIKLNNMVTDEITGKDFNTRTGDFVDVENELVVSGELTLKHEFINLPDSVSEDEVLRLIEESTLSDEFIHKLVNSKLFQNLDLKVKEKIKLKLNRNRGV